MECEKVDGGGHVSGQVLLGSLTLRVREAIDGGVNRCEYRMSVRGSR